MQRVYRLFIAIALLAIMVSVLILTPHPTSAQDGGQQNTQHVVQRGESLYGIARQYGVTVLAIAQANNISNPNLIYVGQVLKIPVATTPTATTPAPTTPTTPTTPAPTTVTPAATTPPPATGPTVHVVQVGENLYRIALKYGTTVQAISQANGITNPNLIYVGMQLNIPAPGAPLAVVPAATTPAPTTPAPTTPAPAGTTEAAGGETTEVATTPAPPSGAQAAAVPFDYGIQVQLFGQDTAKVIDNLTRLGVSWVKQEISWATFEPTKGNINFDDIDTVMDALDGAGFSIMLTVYDAPDWARGATEENGPPTDNQDFANFMTQLATRYAGRVDAYEIWKEPNLRREWNGKAYGKPLSAAGYVELLRAGYTAVKAADSEAVVVSGGLAPTGLDSPDNAISDRNFLRQMYQAGFNNVADAIGVHPFGFGNPPDSTCCETIPQITGWDDHPSFFFQNTLQDYRAIMSEFNDSGRFLWLTEFGWGSSENLPGDVNPNYGFVEFTSLDEQSQYTIRAFEIGNELGFVGPMFLWNLNFCEVFGIGSAECYWSLLDPAGNPKPVFFAVEGIEK
ncbi:MAG: LysM peptidoglycan-binding domain-containing protein [Chloroflexi bacterium]|nr:LysM peptidoglycan-binding domain-containing protein [Chloroflexota bacterium]